MGAVHGLDVSDIDLRDTRGRFCSEGGVLARDDRAVDVHVVLCGQKMAFGDVLGGTADGELGVKLQIKLASLVCIVTLLLPEDYAEGWMIST